MQDSRGRTEYPPSHGEGFGRHRLKETSACRKGKPAWCSWMLFGRNGSCFASATNSVFTSTLADQTLIFGSCQHFMDTQIFLGAGSYLENIWGDCKWNDGELFFPYVVCCTMQNSHERNVLTLICLLLFFPSLKWRSQYHIDVCTLWNAKMIYKDHPREHGVTTTDTIAS